MNIGIDIADKTELRKIINNKKYLNFLFTNKEIEAAGEFSENRKIEYYAGRFSSKEAVAKALGTGFLTKEKVTWRDIEVLNDIDGRPVVRLHNNVKSIFENKDLKGLNLSISHKNDSIISVALVF